VLSAIGATIWFCPAKFGFQRSAGQIEQNIAMVFPIALLDAIAALVATAVGAPE
jgi:hypothetical protein